MKRPSPFVYGFLTALVLAGAAYYAIYREYYAPLSARFYIDLVASGRLKPGDSLIGGKHPPTPDAGGEVDTGSGRFQLVTYQDSGRTLVI
jgi:hypothetical protein